MSTKTDTRPERIDTDEGRAWILAEADGKEELVEELERLIDGYRLYFEHPALGRELVGVYPTLGRAIGEMTPLERKVRIDLDLWIMRGDEVVHGERPPDRGQISIKEAIEG